MARQPMVTRTIVTTKANVLCMDLSTQTPITKEVILPRTYKDNKALLKAVQNNCDSETVKTVHIQSSEEVQTLYGMTEQDFINHASILDPETRKMIETSEADEKPEESAKEETTDNKTAKKK